MEQGDAPEDEPSHAQIIRRVGLLSFKYLCSEEDLYLVGEGGLLRSINEATE